MTNFLVVLADARFISTQVILNKKSVVEVALELAQRNADAVRIFVNVPGGNDMLREFAIDRRHNAVQVRRVVGVKLERA